MPTADERRKRSGVVRVRTRRLADGTLLRVYVYRKKQTPPKKGSGK